MIPRAPILLALFTLAGCQSPNIVIRKEQPAAAAKKGPPPAKFAEYASVTEPGQYVQKNLQPDTAVTDTGFWPKKDEIIKPIAHMDPLLQVKQNDPPLVLALREYVEGRTDKALERIKDLDVPNQKMILMLLSALVHASRADLSGNSPTDAAVLASQLETAADTAGKMSPLKIRKTCFVWRVTQFGVYEPVPEKHPFLPGGSGVLYLELQNAPSLPADLPAGGKGFVTKLTCSHQLLDAEGKPVSTVKKFDHAEFTRSPVKDYFLKIEFDVPPQPGSYSLVVEIADGPKRKARQQIELKVGG